MFTKTLQMCQLTVKVVINAWLSTDWKGVVHDVKFRNAGVSFKKQVHSCCKMDNKGN